MATSRAGWNRGSVAHGGLHAVTPEPPPRAGVQLALPPTGAHTASATRHPTPAVGEPIAVFWCSTVNTGDIREVKYGGKRKKTHSVLFPSGLDFKDPLENNLLLLCSYGAGGVTRSAERGGARA